MSLLFLIRKGLALALGFVFLSGAISVHAQIAPAPNPPGQTLPSPAPPGVPQRGVLSTDDQIAIAIYRALYLDPRVVSAYTDVAVTNGVATLTGSVPTPEARLVAEDLAARTPGVTRVINWLEVIAPVPDHPDEEIYRNLRHALGTDPQVNRYPVQIAVLNGQVYLAGSVDTVSARAKIANLAAEVPGVVAVENALTVPQRGDPYDHWSAGGLYPRTGRPNDAELQRQIDARLRSSALLDARRVRVQVKDGVATLTGSVGSEVEKTAAVHNAFAAGAKDVRDQLSVVPPGRGK